MIFCTFAQKNLGNQSSKLWQLNKLLLAVQWAVSIEMWDRRDIGIPTYIFDKKIETYADFDSIYFIPMIMVFLLMKFWISNLPTENLVFSTIFTSMHLQSSIWNPKVNKTSTFDSVLWLFILYIHIPNGLWFYLTKFG